MDESGYNFHILEDTLISYLSFLYIYKHKDNLIDPDLVNIVDVNQLSAMIATYGGNSMHIPSSDDVQYSFYVLQYVMYVIIFGHTEKWLRENKIDQQLSMPKLATVAREFYDTMSDDDKKLLSVLANRIKDDHAHGGRKKD